LASHKRIARDSHRSLDTDARRLATSLPNIAQLVEYGQITVGVLHRVGAVAVASDGHNSLAMLVRRQGETLEALLTRLDQLSTKQSTKKSSPTRSTPLPRRSASLLRDTHVSMWPAPGAYARTSYRWHMSAAARAKLAASKKAWWAKRKGQKVVSIPPKRRISAAGIARIRAAAKA